MLWFTVLININLAIMNLLPIPVLDGGHMLIATLSKLSGRALPARFIAATQATFMVLLLTMMVYVTSHDVRRWVRDWSYESAPAPATPPPAKPAATDPADNKQPNTAPVTHSPATATPPATPAPTAP